MKARHLLAVLVLAVTVCRARAAEDDPWPAFAPSPSPAQISPTLPIPRITQPVPQVTQLPPGTDLPATTYPMDAGAPEFSAFARGPGGYQPLTISGSYLMGFVSPNGASLPLLTTGGAGRGILGRPDTVVLLRASDTQPTGPASGADFNVKYGLDSDVALDGRFLFLGQDKNIVRGGNGLGSPLLSIPFNDTVASNPGPGLTQIANPNVSTGQVRFDSESFLWGLEGNVQLGTAQSDMFRFTPLAGIRYLNFAENLAIVQNVASVGAQVLSFQGNLLPATDSLRIADSFRAGNQFVGGNVGLRAELPLTESLSLNVTGRAAVGAGYHTLNVAGNTRQINPVVGPVASATGGIFAQPNNIGHTVKNSFSIVPEFDTKLVWALSERTDLSLGYQFLYWNNVLRPANQLPGTINTTTAPSQATFGDGGPIPPTPAFDFSSLSIHALNVGVTFRF